MAERFTLYIIRHAQSANNAVAESQRVEDPAITEIGHVQVKRLAERFRDLRLTNALTSAFLRAVQTMQPVAQAVNLRPVIWTDLHEVGGCFRGHEVGRMEGRPGMDRETLLSRFPDFELPDDIDENGWWKNDSFEDIQEAQERAERQAIRLLREFGGTTAKVACVIHADFKDLLLEALLKSDYETYRHSDLLNTGVTTLACGKDDIEVVGFNDVGHLGDELVTS